MKTRLIFLLLLFDCYFLVAQNTFQKVIQNQKNASIVGIKSSIDGQAAYATNSDGGSVSANLFKIDNNGNIEWAKKIVENNAYYLDNYTPVANGVILPINIFENSNLQIAHLIRIDAQGKVLWRKKIANDSLYINQLIEDDDGNFWTTINKIQKANLYSKYTFLVKIDPNGNVLNCKEIKFNGSKVGGWRIAFDKKNKSIVVNLNDDYTSDKNYIFTFDKQANLKWAKSFPPYLHTFDWKTMSSSIVFSAGVSLTNQGYLSMVVGKINMANGNIEALKLISKNEFPYISTNDNQIALGFFESKKLMKLDENLNPIWTKTYEKCIEAINFFPSLTPSGACFFVKQSSESKKFIYGKTNTKGQIENCDLIDAMPIAMKDTAWTQPQTFSNFTISDANIIFSNSSIKVENTALTIEDYCPRPDASFSIPKFVCENSDFKPFNIKFPNDKHLWTFGAEKSVDTTPIINFNTFGKKRIFHQVSIENCSDTLSKYIEVLQTPILPKDTLVCGYKTVLMDFKNSLADSFFLNNDSFLPPLTISKSGVYNFLLKNKTCKTNRDVSIKFTEVPTVSFPIDSTYCRDEPYTAQLSGFQKVTWDKNIIADTLWIRDAATHSYEAQYNGCKVTGTLKIPRKNCSLPEILYVPNAFSPNGDGINDLFQIFGKDFELLHIAIFDRWGNQVYDSTLPDSVWNGMFRNQLLQSGVYTYFIDYQDIKRNIKRKKVGDVTLIH